MPDLEKSEIPPADGADRDWIATVYGPAVEIIANTLMDCRGRPLGPIGSKRVARTVLARLAQAEPPLTVALLSSAGAKGAAEELLRAAEGVHEAILVALGPDWLVKKTYGFSEGKALVDALIRMRTAIIDVKEEN
jgi:hypothetical protein